MDDPDQRYRIKINTHRKGGKTWGSWNQESIEERCRIGVHWPKGGDSTIVRWFTGDQVKEMFHLLSQNGEVSTKEGGGFFQWAQLRKNKGSVTPAKTEVKCEPLRSQAMTILKLGMLCEQCTCRGSGKPPLNIGLGNGLNLMLRRNISMKQTHSPEKLYWWAFCILKFSPPSSAKTNDQWQLWDSADDQPPVWIIDIWLSSEERTEFWRQSYYQQICLGPSPFHGIWITYYLTWSSLSTCICESYVLTVILLWCLFQGP